MSANSSRMKYSEAGAVLLALHGCTFCVQILGTIFPHARPMQAPKLIAPLPPTVMSNGKGVWPASRCETVQFKPAQLHCTFGEGVSEICAKSGVANRTNRIPFCMLLF